MHIIKSIHIEKFRAFHALDIPTDKNVIAIAGQNGTQKTTLLGMLAQPFSLSLEEAKLHDARTIEGGVFCSQLDDKFKFTLPHDRPGEHLWTVDIDQAVYAKRLFRSESILRSKQEKRLRFWNADDRGHKKGKGFVHCPTVFLSLSRLVQWGEVKKEKQDSFALTNEEMDLYKDWHKSILIAPDVITSVHTLEGSGGKASIGPETSDYDPTSMSAGQDSLGRIILTVLSFRRLMSNPNYNGGMVFIDEIETTMFPAAQIKLLATMFKWASDFKLQFFFTTHSETILKFLRTGKYQKEAGIVFLTKTGNNIKAETDLEWPQMKADLEVTTVSSNLSLPEKIKVYAEDDVAFLILKALSAKFRARVAFQTGVSLSNGHYLELLRKKVPEFTSSIIVLDADTKKRKEFRHPGFKNVVYLPGEEKCPELNLYNFLQSLPEDDWFWSQQTGGYKRNVCFRDYPDVTEVKPAKEWFESQRANWGRACSKLVKRYIQAYSDEMAVFEKSLIGIFNRLATKHGYKLIEE
jgi:predicted ATPase